MRNRTVWTFLGTAVCLVGIVRQVACGAVTDLAYSYSTQGAGGIALLRVDTESGKIVDQQVLLETKACGKPNKLRRTPGRQTFVLTNEAPEGPHVFLAGRDGARQRNLVLPAMPDELRVSGNLAVATCEDDWIALVDLQQARVTGRWNVTELLSPAGNMPESVFVLPAGTHAIVSLQKDSKQGKKLGSRLAVFELPAMRLVADIRLPRTHPELHIAGDLKEQGPSPEVVFVSEPTDTLIATLDLYGAAALMDWSAAKAGKLANWVYLPTSANGSWGTAFPDRATLLSLAQRPCTLVCNAGTEGGAVLIDLAARKLTWRGDVPPGLEPPVYLPELRKAYSVCSGKTKQRTRRQVNKTYQPRQAVYVFDFTASKPVDHPSVRQVPLGLFAIRLASVGDGRPLLVVAAGQQEPDTILTFDPRTEHVMDRAAARGVVAQFEAD